MALKRFDATRTGEDAHIAGMIGWALARAEGRTAENPLVAEDEFFKIPIFVEPSKTIVYLMECPCWGKDVRKIGYARNVPARRFNLETAVPEDIRIAAWAYNDNGEGSALEALLHEHFGDVHINREFFLVEAEQFCDAARAAGAQHVDINTSEDEERIPIGLVVQRQRYMPDEDEVD